MEETDLSKEVVTQLMEQGFLLSVGLFFNREGTLATAFRKGEKPHVFAAALAALTWKASSVLGVSAERIVGMQIDFLAEETPNELDGHWEDLLFGTETLPKNDTGYYGVFFEDGCASIPEAIFKSEEAAKAWIEGDERRNAMIVMACRNLTGQCWNSVEDPPPPKKESAADFSEDFLRFVANHRHLFPDGPVPGGPYLVTGQEDSRLNGLYEFFDDGGKLGVRRVATDGSWLFYDSASVAPDGVYEMTQDSGPGVPVILKRVSDVNAPLTGPIGGHPSMFLDEG